VTDEELEDYRRKIEAHQRWQAENDPIQPGYTRIYIDHTGRVYQDVKTEDLENDRNDPLRKLLLEEIQKEINREIIATLQSSRSKS
jgi:hypothetical protein